MSDKFLVFLNDGETFTELDGAVIRGDWDDVDIELSLAWFSAAESFAEDDDEQQKQFQKHIKEVLILNEENLQKIKKALPELWLTWDEVKIS